MATKKRTIDLSGPEGNAFVLLGIAQSLSKQLNKNWKEIEKDMTSDDYEHLIKVFERAFGEFVDLKR